MSLRWGAGAPHPSLRRRPRRSRAREAFALVLERELPVELLAAEPIAARCVDAVAIPDNQIDALREGDGQLGAEARDDRAQLEVLSKEMRSRGKQAGGADQGALALQGSLDAALDVLPAFGVREQMTLAADLGTSELRAHANRRIQGVGALG